MMIPDDFQMMVVTAKQRNSKRWKQETVTWSGLKAWAANPADHKECGNYLLGELRPNADGVLIRNNHTIVRRHAISLDVDSPNADFLVKVELLLPGAAIIHSTYNSTPDQPRYRLIIPTDRPMLPDEYIVAADYVMNLLGRENFDPGGNEPARYMFKPATSDPEHYVYQVLDGDLTEADSLLQSFQDDLSGMPTPRVSRTKRDPYEIEGVVGAFNRVYRFPEAIDEWELPYDLDGDNRWHLRGTRAAGGLALVKEGIVFSHHMHDPAYNQACSAFDLVRLHKFGHLDEGAKAGTPINRLPSSKAMEELAMNDERTHNELVGKASDDFAAFAEGHADEISEMTRNTSWRTQLAYTSKGKMIDKVANWRVLMEHDGVLSTFRYNELTLEVELSEDLPWRKVGVQWAVSDIDERMLLYYIEEEYNIRPPRVLVTDLIIGAALQHRINPVVDYLRSLKWDGTPRVETCLPVTATPYTRVVARKCMVAAVARMLDPGCKWDHTLVLFGDEGLGKTWWVDKMSLGYTSTLGRIDGKDTLLAMQRSWIMVADEGYSLKKADADGMKEFLTRTKDVFRAPYERTTSETPRHCVIWSTTNDKTFLRRQEGNRRFLIVDVEQQVNFERYTDEYVGQVWAEAVQMYEKGEKLYLTPEEMAAARESREIFVEEDALVGIIEEYLSTPVPKGWSEKTPTERRIWMENDGDVFEQTEAADSEITEVCSLQIWVEVLGRDRGDHRRMDLLNITKALHEIPGWEAVSGRHRINGYGPQMVFRKTSGNSDDWDVL